MLRAKCKIISIQGKQNKTKQETKTYVNNAKQSKEIVRAGNDIESRTYKTLIGSHRDYKYLAISPGSRPQKVHDEFKILPALTDFGTTRF